MRHTIICADAQEALKRPGMGIGDIEAIITDPPYCSGARRDAERQVRGTPWTKDDKAWFSHDHMTTWGFTWFLRAVLNDARPHLVEGAHLYVFTDWRQTPNVYAILESCGYRVNHCLVWRKTNFGLGAYWRNQHENIVFASVGTPAPMLVKDRGTVLDAPNVSPAARKHPTEKPIELIDQIVSAIPAKRILDPFAGSGAVGVSALRHGREFVGIEIDPRHAKNARARLVRSSSAPQAG